MKRRATARCAAANDDDFGSPSESEHIAVKARRRAPEAPAKEREGQSSAGEGGGKRKKKKEFAWMDSEEEDDGEGEAHAEEGEAREEDRAGSAEESREGSEEEQADVSIESLDMVQSFGRMMLLAPALRARLRGGSMSAEDVTAACRALGRTKFFDADILKELNEVLRRLLQADKLSVAQANDAIKCLWDLNAYDPGVFSAVARAFRPRTATVEPFVRSLWLEVFRGFGHDLDKDFLQLLEVLPLTPMTPGYGRIRCRHHSQGFCALDKACSFSHDPRAPMSLESTVPVSRSSPLLMTQDQYTMGRDVYGGARNGQFF